jgi:hypothetical protein
MYQNEGKYTKWPINYQMAIRYIPNGRNIFPMAIENTNFLNSKALQNLPKFGLLV